MTERMIAAVVLLACVVAAVRLAIGASRRARLDAALRRWVRWPKSRRQARQEALEAIERARRQAAARDVERDGNVYRPRSFDRDPPSSLH
ncbi:MAG: hypothetical protein MUF03_01790 [Rubrivivax sp.]|jgi:Arc/MetJ family transcription regulator|nr:hypothetical protein [Rubrivivax sp.]